MKTIKLYLLHLFFRKEVEEIKKTYASVLVYEEGERWSEIVKHLKKKYEN